MDSRRCVCYCFLGCSVSTASYVIRTSLSWVYALRYPPDPEDHDEVGIAAAILFTLPVFIFIFFAILCRCLNEETAQKCCSALSFTLSTLVQVSGEITLIVSMVKREEDFSEMGDSATSSETGSIAFGTLAAIFNVVSIISNCFTACCSAAATKPQKDETYDNL